MVANRLKCRIALSAYVHQSECKTVRDVEAGEKLWLMGNIDLLYILLLSLALI